MILVFFCTYLGHFAVEEVDESLAEQARELLSMCGQCYELRQVLRRVEAEDDARVRAHYCRSYSQRAKKSY